jgi:hypothetical protein
MKQLKKRMKLFVVLFLSGVCAFAQNNEKEVFVYESNLNNSYNR